MKGTCQVCMRDGRRLRSVELQVSIVAATGEHASETLTLEVCHPHQREPAHCGGAQSVLELVGDLLTNHARPIDWVAVRAEVERLMAKDGSS